MTKARNLARLASVNTSIVGNTVFLSGNVSLANATLSLGANTINSTSLTSTGVVANSYGNTTAIPVITVDAAGRITNATTSSVSGVTGLSYTAANSTVTVSTSTTNFNAVITSGNSTVQGLLTVIDSVSNTSTSIAGSANSVTTAYLLAANAVSNATAYAATAYSNAVATAASDATTKAGTAYSNATTFATTAAGTAYSNAVSVAASDATTKAGTAYSNAVSVASSDATTKAGTAYSNAIAYANTVAYTAAGTAYSNVFNGGTFSGAVTVQANLTANSVRMNGNLQVDGDLTVSGNTVTINVTNLNVDDNMIYLNSNSTVSHPDLGFAGNYNDGTYRHAGLFRDATDGVWKFFHGYTPEPDASAFIDTANTSFALSNLQINYVIGNVTGSANSATYLGGNTASTLRSYSDTMAGTAYSNATSYAATIAGTAYSNAVSVASSDATTKAGTAYSNATTYAATIAGTAYTNAVSVASSDATTKAGTAYSNATSYAATIAGTAYSNAVSVAASDATTKAGTAYSNATAFAANATNISSGTLSASRLPATYLTSVTGTAPVVSSGGATPAISMAAANSTVAGYMTTTYASKLDGIAASATNVTNNNQLTNGAGYVTSSGVTAVTATGPVVSSGGTTPVISMAAATASVDGYMTTAFASKLNGIAASATNVTNNNQLTNGAGYITGYTETDTLATVTGRGASTSTTVTLSQLNISGSIVRTAAGAGYLNGNYPSSETVTTSGAIYSIGGASYNPTSTTLGTMYGVGYAYSGSGRAVGTNPAGAPIDNWGCYGADAGTLKWFLSTTTGAGYFTGLLQATSFYDSNNTAYYVDPNSTSRIRKTNLIASGSGWDDGLNLYSSDETNRWNFLVDNGAADAFRLAYNNSEALQISTGRNITAIVDIRSPIFYDSNDTGYYVDAASTSELAYLSNGTKARAGMNIHHTNRQGNTADTNYWVGSQGWYQTYNLDSCFVNLGSCFFDHWGATAHPRGSVHCQGIQALHYRSGTVAYGFQLVNGGDGSPRMYTRAAWGGGGGSWYELALWGLNTGGALYPTVIYDSNNTAYYVDPNNTTYVNILRTTNWLYLDNNYGHSVVGVYNSYRYQGVFAMGDAYKLPADGTTTGGLYGMAWSHPNAGGAAGNLTDHGLLIINAGAFKCAISNSIVAAANITAYSDERLKKNWRDMPENYVARLAQVKVGIYDRIDQDNITQVGVSAQSFQKLLPQAIQTAKDDMQTLSVSYGNAALASAVELAKEVVLLKETISSQEARIAKLEALINKLVG